MTVLNNEDPANPSVHEPSYAELPEPRMWYDHTTQRCSGMAPIGGTNEPLWDASDMRSAIATGRAEADALRAALQPFADTDLTNPLVRDTFGFDVLRARAALQNHSRKDPAT